MADDDPRRLDEIRKYAAIYGRFDCKRKPEKPLTLHEVSVNEAAAQICKHIPALLTRRDELFPLARQVVRDSGYQYSKGHSRSQSNLKRTLEEAGLVSNNSSNKFFNSSTSNDTSKVDTDDTDSQYSIYSNRSESQSNDAGDSSNHPHHQGSSVSVTETPPGGNENLSKLLPAKKSGNFGGASQIAKQLVQETLLDEGLRVVKEYTGTNSNGSDDCINLSCNGRNDTNGNHSGSSSSNSMDDQMSPKVDRSTLSSSLCSGGGTSAFHSNVNVIASSHSHAATLDIEAACHLTPDSLCLSGTSSTGGHHLITTTNTVSPSLLFSNGHILPPAPPSAPLAVHRPRGRPPKAISGLRNLEAAYHEKLTQHLQQSFLATQAYNQVMQAAAVAAVANGFTGGSGGGGGGGSGGSSSSNNSSNSVHVSGSLGAAAGVLVPSTISSCNGEIGAGENGRGGNCKIEQDDDRHHSIKMQPSEQNTGEQTMVHTTVKSQILQSHLNHHSSSLARTNGYNGQQSKESPSETDLLSTDFTTSSRPITSSPILSLQGDNNVSNTSSHFTDH